MEPAASSGELLKKTRRQFFDQCGVGVGKVALASLLSGDRLAAAGENGLTGGTHFPAKVKSVIYLFMVGGPSQLELFDYKPKLQQFDNTPAPESILKGKRFAFMESFAKAPKLVGPKRKFQRHGQSGIYVSESLPHIASMVDDLSVLLTVHTENFNHAPAKIYTNTGSTRFGRPSMGSWITYGLGSESKSLPGFVVLHSGSRTPRGGALNWSSGFLPTSHQGVVFRNAGDPILNLSSPEGVSADLQARTLDTIRELNSERLERTGDQEIATRIASYEMAFRMQTSGPELIDLSKESKETLELYGAEPGKASYANNCLLARRLVERGVRFVQLYHADWDHHDDLTTPLDKVCREIDRATAALLQDLKRQGLLDSTLVVWGGEFGRTPMGEDRVALKVGRNHHIDAYTVWMAGGGIRKGQTVGVTDELGFGPVEQPIDVHDIQATILHQLGVDHTKLTFKFQGRDFRLTDVGGQVIQSIVG